MHSHRGRRDDDGDVSSDPEQQLRRFAGNLEKRFQYSLHRHDKDTVLLPSAPPGATTDRERQTTTEGHGEEDRHDQPGTPCHHGGNAGGVNIITSVRTGKTQGKTTHGQRGKYNYIQPGKQNKQVQEDEDEDEDEDDPIS
jgi:hypothetical protein